MPQNDGFARRKLERDPDAPAPDIARAAYVELGVTSPFSFLRGASDAIELALTALRQGHDSLGIADRNTLAGVVRMHSACEGAGLKPLIGCRLDIELELVRPERSAKRVVEGRPATTLCQGPSTSSGPTGDEAGQVSLLAYPIDRDGYGRLSRLLSLGKMRAEKGECLLSLGDVAMYQEGIAFIAWPQDNLDAFEADLPRLRAALPSLGHVAASWLYRGDDAARIERLDRIAKRNGCTILATNDVHYHAPDRRPLQDVMSCIREKVTLVTAGYRLNPNAERHLKSPDEMMRLFARWPHAISATREFADALHFSLNELRYEYPRETVPEGRNPQQHLEHLTWEGARRFWGDKVPYKVLTQLSHELALIAKLDFARYFLTVHDIVAFARSLDPPILCQGRGSAANSAVCYCLGITAVDPSVNDLLFERFISEERKEPPDIDVDFEHERREEVIQHIYQKYGRDRAGIAATVIHYRPRSAIREVGKVMGLSEDVCAAIASNYWGSMEAEVAEERAADAGLDLSDPHLKRVMKLAEQLIGMPRHLSQHVGGFILTERPLTETVPIGNGAMDDRTFIEWDKDDIEELGILKIDVLALGMLTCCRKAFDLIKAHHDTRWELATVPREVAQVYDMLCKGDSLGVFQVESRAQMNMLPRLRPREFYDLVIEVAIVRPGPIQGDMVHPYLKRRQGKEPVTFPCPDPEHGEPDELARILGRTLGVPIFQEQAMKIALDAAKFTPAEANQLRKAMATFRSRGNIDLLQDKMVERMVTRGYDRDFAERCFHQIRGFGEYGFPESHAASFAHLVYVSSWIKWRYPAAFACALLNSQPMGFYAPAQIVRDAEAHGVEVLPVDVNCSEWDCTLEEVESNPTSVRPERSAEREVEGRLAQPSQLRPSTSSGRTDVGHFALTPRRNGWATTSAPATAEVHPPDANEKRMALRLGLRMVEGLRLDAATRIVGARGDVPYSGIEEVRRRSGAGVAAIERLAEADAFGSLGLDRRGALWDARALKGAPDLPLFAQADMDDEGWETEVVRLPAMPMAEQVVIDYQTTRLSLKAHPMQFLRDHYARRGFVAAGDLRKMRYGRRVSLAGLVLIRQRPGSAKGVCFITLEDETGVANLVVWPDRFAANRRIVMGARLMVVHGVVQHDEAVVHVVAAGLEDDTGMLRHLAEDSMPSTLSRGDGGGSWRPPAARHPRDAEIIPKSRDFH
ncbi:error-prone DNA polymerase [Sphingomonas lutea]|uniref:Error-prone DNA polymerase n=1 Tax=Sphingomonas lutea TaxID=1045317 RepID=A0A7G9SIT3_9SPHN|nr:error-prone DNA polymerase [Sphingomonas lutea]QNN67758.1 error-prone DNA polymerase [Sphingomonas lutea]